MSVLRTYQINTNRFYLIVAVFQKHVDIRLQLHICCRGWNGHVALLLNSKTIVDETTMCYYFNRNGENEEYLCLDDLKYVL